MRLSAPIYRLKQQAKQAARQKGLPLHQALDQIASKEGFQSWSHLSNAMTMKTPASAVLAQLGVGDMVLLGARPQQGKTLLGLELAVRAQTIGKRGYFFTLDYSPSDVRDQLDFIGMTSGTVQDDLVIDTSDEISASYIVSRVREDAGDALIVIDYLQLLDQKRSHPNLADQMALLADYATNCGAICVVISQIDRSFDAMGKSLPDLSDVRLPNPLDLSVFDRTCFLHEGRVEMGHINIG